MSERTEVILTCNGCGKEVGASPGAFISNHPHQGWFLLERHGDVSKVFEDIARQKTSLWHTCSVECLQKMITDKPFTTPEEPFNAKEFVQADSERVMGSMTARLSPGLVLTRINGPWICAKGLAETFKASYILAEDKLFKKVKEAQVKHVLEVEMEEEPTKWKDCVRLVAVCLVSP